MTDARTILGADAPAAAPSRRLTVIAEQLAGKLIGGAYKGAEDYERRELAMLSTALLNIARAIEPSPTAAPSDIIAAIRSAATDGDLADAWRDTKALRLDLSTADQSLVTMEWIDRATALAMDDGR